MDDALKGLISDLVDRIDRLLEQRVGPLESARALLNDLPAEAAEHVGEYVDELEQEFERRREQGEVSLEPGGTDGLDPLGRYLLPRLRRWLHCHYPVHDDPDDLFDDIEPDLADHVRRMMDVVDRNYGRAGFSPLRPEDRLFHRWGLAGLKDLPPETLDELEDFVQQCQERFVEMEAAGTAPPPPDPEVHVDPASYYVLEELRTKLKNDFPSLHHRTIFGIRSLANRIPRPEDYASNRAFARDMARVVLETEPLRVLKMLDDDCRYMLDSWYCDLMSMGIAPRYANDDDDPLADELKEWMPPLLARVAESEIDDEVELRRWFRRDGCRLVPLHGRAHAYRAVVHEWCTTILSGRHRYGGVDFRRSRTA